MTRGIDVAAETSRALKQELHFRRLVHLVSDIVSEAAGKNAPVQLENFRKRALDIAARTTGEKRLNAEIAANLLSVTAQKGDDEIGLLWGDLVGGSMILGMKVMAHLIATQEKAGLGWVEELAHIGSKVRSGGRKGAARSVGLHERDLEQRRADIRIAVRCFRQEGLSYTRASESVGRERGVSGRAIRECLGKSGKADTAPRSKRN